MPSNEPSFLCQQAFWSHNDNPIWLASTIHFFRNIEKYQFPHKLDVERRKQIITILGKELANHELLGSSTLLKAEDLSAFEKEYLSEHFLTHQSFHQAGIGEAFLINKSGTFLASLNIQDHIQLELIDTQGDIESSWNQLISLESFLGKNVHYSFSSKFGFLTADPFQCGTGLRVHVFLQLSGLIHAEKVNETLENLIDDSLAVMGLQGSPTEIIGDVLTLHNQFTLGVTEESILSHLRSITTKLLVEEQAARNQIRNEKSAAMKDKISRAYGILMHSYQIEAVEALNALSLLKLGADVGWCTGFSQRQFNELFFNCRRAHLLCQFSEKPAQEEIPRKRAEFIHNALKDLKMGL